MAQLSWEDKCIVDGVKSDKLEESWLKKPKRDRAAEVASPKRFVHAYPYASPLVRPNTTRKLVIKNFERVTLPADYESVALSQLRAAVLAVQRATRVDTPLQALYHAVENLCSHGSAPTLHQNLRQLCDEHVKAMVEPLLAPSDDGTAFLRRLCSLWQAHCRQTALIRSVFLFLDRTYVLQSAPRLPSLWDAGLDAFRAHVLAHPAVRQRTADGLLAAVAAERAGQTVDRSLVKNLIRMLLDLQIYHEVFESSFLKATEELYAEEGQRLMQELEASAYVVHAERRLSEEWERALQYLDGGTKRPLLQLVEKQLVAQHLTALLAKGLDQLLEEHRLEDLQRLYGLCVRVREGEVALCSAFGAHVRRAGRAIVHKEKSMVQELLALKDRLDQVVTQCFRKSDRFSQAVKEALEQVVNSRPNKPAELIAKHLDLKLRAGNKEATEEELEHLLDKMMVLFRCIHGKDVFEAFYKKDLAKRLLLGKSASVDAERSMLSKLKQECGAQFTSKLEGMFKDIDLSRHLMAAFRQSQQSKSAGPSGEMQVLVLTQGYWPTYGPAPLTLPSEMAAAQDVFRNFYLQKHAGRKLAWQPSLAHCVLRAHFPHATKELLVSLYQGVVLLLWNGAQEELSLEEVRAAVGMEEGELRRTLQSLACGKARVLLKTPRSKEVGDEDHFRFNSDFKNKLFRIKVNQVQLRETAEEQGETQERVFQDRQYAIDAAVVRVMKTRRSLAHAPLVAALLEHLPFPVRPHDLKKRIESLIDRDYLHRDHDNPNTYHYVA